MDEYAKDQQGPFTLPFALELQTYIHHEHEALGNSANFLFENLIRFRFW